MSTLTLFPKEQITMVAAPHQSSYYHRLLDLIEQSKQSILICQYVFSTSTKRNWERSNKILKALIDAKKRGIEVEILFDRPKPHTPNSLTNARTAIKLSENDINVRCLSVLKTLHLKMVIIDRKLFLAGSHNITNSSLYSPFELSFECSDEYLVNCAVVYFHALFNGTLSEPYMDALNRTDLRALKSKL